MNTYKFTKSVILQKSFVTIQIYLQINSIMSLQYRSNLDPLTKKNDVSINKTPERLLAINQMTDSPKKLEL